MLKEAEVQSHFLAKVLFDLIEWLLVEGKPLPVLLQLRRGEAVVKREATQDPLISNVPVMFV
jgi:hypothetical protein